MYKTYTGIGSRETPKEVLTLMEKLAYTLADDGWDLRSGGAKGADTAFYNGSLQRSMEGGGEREFNKEIYTPWKGFGNWDEIVATNLPNFKEAMKLAEEIHPYWGNLKEPAKKLHARNCYQVLGHHLNSPSKFLVCYCKLNSKGEPSGGTRTAIKLAEKFNVPVFNLYLESDVQRISKFVDK